MSDGKAVRVKAGIPRGMTLLRDPLLTKGSAFPLDEREALGLTGLLPPHVNTIEQQKLRALENVRRKSNDLERYLYLTGMQDRNETLFYSFLVDNLEQLMPYVYTPTVGQACQLFGHLFRRTRGLYVSALDRGRVAELLRNWPQDDVRVVVMTDGERILGLGDQGVGGMGIPVGKLSLYTAIAGIHPRHTLPVMIDVGTDNAALREDPLYMGLRQPRVRGADFQALVGEFITAANERWPKVLVQFEDFANTTAFTLLEHWRDRACTFNDDIQGTAAVSLAGLYSALRVTGQKLSEQRLLFLGAGEAGTGIADLIVSAMVDEGSTVAEARRRCWFVDSQGLVVESREQLAEHKKRYAHPAPFHRTFLEAVEALRPTGIIGVSTMPGTFDRPVLEAMARLNQRPIVFALSNPTSRSECTAEEAYRFTGGRALFASGSPFSPFTFEGREVVTGQGNNAYIFPGVGLGVLVSEARRVTDRLFAASARALAAQTTPADLALGRLYPALSSIREVTVHLAAAVARLAFDDGLAAAPRPPDIEARVRAHMWTPRYERYLLD